MIQIAASDKFFYMLACWLISNLGMLYKASYSVRYGQHSSIAPPASNARHTTVHNLSTIVDVANCDWSNITFTWAHY